MCCSHTYQCNVLQCCTVCVAICCSLSHISDTVLQCFTHIRHHVLQCMCCSLSHISVQCVAVFHTHQCNVLQSFTHIRHPFTHMSNVLQSFTHMSNVLQCFTHMSLTHTADCSVSHKIRLEHIATHTVHNFVSITTLCQSRLCVNHVCV